MKLTRESCSHHGSNQVTVSLHHFWPTNGAKESTIFKMFGKQEMENVM